MSLRAPSFDTTTYNCLKPDLSAVPYWREVQSVLGKMDEVKAEKSRLLAEKGPQHERICAAVVNAFAEEAAVQKNRLDRVPLLAERLARLQAYPGGSEWEIRAIHNELALLYSTIDTESFKSDWARLYGDSNTPKKVAKLDGRLGGLTKALGEIRQGLGKCFVGDRVPRKWGRISIPDSAPTEVVNTTGETIINSFILDWRVRAPLFAVPVTVYGTAIRSLSSDAAMVWLSAYESLGLQHLVKHPVYYALDRGDRKHEQLLQAQARSEGGVE